MRFDRLERAVRQLIARIDRDGGHAQDGDKDIYASIERVDKKVAELYGELDSLTETARESSKKGPGHAD